MSDKKNPSNKLDRTSFISRSVLTLFGLVLAGNSISSNTGIKSQKKTTSNNKTAGGNSKIAGKHAELSILNSKPWNAETPPHLLDDKITPADRIFVRNNGKVPENIDVENWTLTIEGESAEKTKTYTLAELKSNFKQYSYQLTLECGGNGRKEFTPAAKGNQWSTGAIACPKWTGIRLKDVLNDVGVKSNAVYIGYYGKDVHLNGDPDKVVISRGVPIKKALEDEALIAWAVNDNDLPLMNGYPLRLVFGGWPASTSGKWLHKISIRDKVHDGPKMDGYSYRIPKYPVAPGTKVPEEDMKIIEVMPVKSLITHPKTGAKVKGRKSFEVRGHAWAGDLSIKEMHISIDYGATWRKCVLDPAINKNAWQQWRIQVALPEKGYHEIWSRATDSEGIMQPMVLPAWNPKGYLNNACHRIATKCV
ncbi:MAG: sulfite oxidase [Crocinitomicaceae bacterium]|nr:sulfite oxidase [Crocinitomicaceae bacterium]